MKKNILEAVRIVRSKNSGPYELTLDLIFKDSRYFNLFREKQVITPELVCRLYGVAREDVLGITYFEPAHAVKMTIRRPITSGAPGDSDVYGAQQHAPLLGIEFEE